MEPATSGHEAVDHDELPVHTWRVARLTRLGIPELLAEIHADHLDWHQIARLEIGRASCRERVCT